MSTSLSLLRGSLRNPKSIGSCPPPSLIKNINVGNHHLRIASLKFSTLSATYVRSNHVKTDSLKSLRHIKSTPSHMLPALWQSTRSYADFVVVKTPHMADSITEGTLKTWHKKPGDFVAGDEEVATIETDKVDVSVNSPESGVIVELFANEEDNVIVGSDLFKIEKKATPPGGAAKPDTQETSPSPAPKSNEEVSKPIQSSPPPPAATTAMPSSSSKKTENVSKPASVTASPSPLDTKTYSRTETKVKMTRMRTRIAERLKESQTNAASLTTFNEVDMSNLIEMRSKYKDAVFKKHSVKLGFMSAFVKASCYAMDTVPVVNARIDDDSIVYPNFVDISVAVATPKGLVTPVLRNCQDMSFVKVEQTIAALGEKARENKISIEDMAGGTFTISNGGVFGSLYGTPIINLPQSAILGMHAIKDRPVVVNGKIEIRPMMYLALTYDHRIIDGREAVTFLVKVKEAIEDPRRLLLDV